MSRDSYIRQMKPYADRVAAAIGISSKVVLAHWILETGSGSSALVKRGSNNHAGIKANSSGRDFVSGAYSGYNSIDSFANDYIRLINKLPYYKGVRNQSDPMRAIQELHKSPWAEDPNQDKKLIEIYNSIADKKIVADYSNSYEQKHNNVIDTEKWKLVLRDMPEEEVKNYALIGLGVASIIALTK